MTDARHSRSGSRSSFQVMSSLTAMFPKGRSKKHVGKVTVVGTLDDVNMPTADNSIRASLLNHSALRKRKLGIPSNPFTDRFSMSETALDRLVNKKEKTLKHGHEVKHANGALSEQEQRDDTSSDSDSGREQDQEQEQGHQEQGQTTGPVRRSHLSEDLSNLRASLSDEQPAQHHATDSVDSGKLTEPGLTTSTSSSSADDINEEVWDQRSSCYTHSSSSSRSSLCSRDAADEPPSPDKASSNFYSIVDPVEAGVFDDADGSASVHSSPRRAQQRSSPITTKPLPSVPLLDSVYVPSVRDLSPTRIVDGMISKFNVNNKDDASSQVTMWPSTEPGLTLSKATEEIMDKLDMMSNEAKRSPSKRRPSTRRPSSRHGDTQQRDTVPALELKKKKSTKQQSSGTSRSPTSASKNTKQSTNKQQQQRTPTLKRTDQSQSKSNKPNPGNTSPVQKQQSESDIQAPPQKQSTADTKSQSNSQKQSTMDRPMSPMHKNTTTDTMTPLHKQSTANTMPALRHQSVSSTMPTLQKHSSANTMPALLKQPTPAASAKGSTRKIGFRFLTRKKHRSTTKIDEAKQAEDRENLARNLERYLSAEISRALREDDDEDETKDKEQDEWATLYPLKAASRLGIPLMTTGRIPTINNERLTQIRPPSPPAQVQTQNNELRRDSAPSSPKPADNAGVVTSPTLPSNTHSTDDGHESDRRSIDGEKIVIGFHTTAESQEEVADDSTNIKTATTLPSHPSEETEKPKTLESPEASMEPQRHVELYELDGSGKMAETDEPQPEQPVRIPMPKDVTDDVLLALLERANTLDDLFNLALINRQTYRLFKAHELRLMKNAMFCMSPAAWELREMSPPWPNEWRHITEPDAPVPEYTPESYLRHHARDIFTLVKLKSLILTRCSSFIRPETIRGLAGTDEKRAAEIDEALWRIWTFCRIFGCGKNREANLDGQTDWLNGGPLAAKQKSGATVLITEPFFSMNNVLFDPPPGFGKGNGSGLTPSQLYDMTEIWNCFGALLQPVLGECAEARAVGIFDVLDVEEGDTDKESVLLEEWMYYVLSLGPSALISMISMCPTDTPKSMFAKAQKMGLTQWEPLEFGASRSSFLRDAVSRVYQSRFTNLSTESGRSSATGRRTGNTSLDLNESARSSQETLSQQQQPPLEPEFIDPVDKAMHRLVHELGFSEQDAKWALKITDMGDTINPTAAERLLISRRKKQREEQRRTNSPIPGRSSPADLNVSTSASQPLLVDPHANSPQRAASVGWRWA